MTNLHSQSVPPANRAEQANLPSVLYFLSSGHRHLAPINRVEHPAAVNLTY